MQWKDIRRSYVGWIGIVLTCLLVGSLVGACDCGRAPVLEGALPEVSTELIVIDGGPVESGPRSCQTRCDCDQGSDCISGTCVLSPTPAYCCDRDGCPQGLPCLNSAGDTGACGLRQSCKHPCDCPQGNACVDGFCSVSNQPVYCCEKAGCVAGQTCSSIRGGTKTCGGEGQPCTTACDCVGGLTCVNGQCTKAGVPFYCCDASNCPAGSRCENARGVQGTCGQTQGCKSSCDCPTGQTCSNGKCGILPVPVYCCDRPDKCPSGQFCDSRDGKRGRCESKVECVSSCDCAQGLACLRGQCTKGGEAVYCCEKPGCPARVTCIRSDGSRGTCSGQKCANDRDCGIQNCTQQGTQCSQVQPFCQDDGTCSSRVKTVAGICRPDSGLCQEVPPECQSPCDCPQGDICSSGRCLTPPPGQEVYCCDKAGCPANQVCLTRDNRKDTCPANPTCRTNSDCGNNTCRTLGNDCEQITATCLRGSCRRATSFQQNSICRIVNGVGSCQPRSNACKTNADCGQPTCRLSGNICIQSLAICTNGACSTRSSGIPNAGCVNGACTQTGQNCRVDCDCTQGQACLNGRCSVPANGVPVYCCDKPGCNAGQACTNRSGAKGTCPKPPQCKVDGDCNKPSCTQNGLLCTSLSYKCVNGVCNATNTASPGVCDSAKGSCSAVTTCRVSCDCPQGQACQQTPLGGICAPGPSPVYCCDKVGCPSNQRCVDSNNRQGTCPLVCTGVCDCPGGFDCVKSRCVASTNPTYCCDNPQQCPSGQACVNKAGQAGKCPTTVRKCKSACDCIQGEDCVSGECKKTSKPVYCCDNAGCKAGETCTNKLGQTGVCPTPCQTPCDCQQGHSCVQGLCSPNPANAFCCNKSGCPANFSCFNSDGSRGRCPVQKCTTACDCNQGEDCRNGQCTRVFPAVYCCSKTGCPAGQACKDTKNQWSTCQAAPACKSACDCPQGRDCFKGQCIQVFPAVYCCTKTGCPAGQACYDSSNNPGVCPGSQCTTSCDCPSQGQSCIRGRCVSANPRIYCCSKPGCQAGQACEDTQGNLSTCGGRSCKVACDCNQGEDCRNGTCVRVSPPVYCCSKSPCQPGQACVKTDGSTATCAVQCRTRCDCQQGFDCFNGACFRRTGAYCCNKSGCPAGQSCQDTNGRTSVCGGTPPPTTCKVACDCNQGQSCLNGTCVTTPNRVYCCDKPGCPRGFSCRDKSDKAGFCSP